MFTKAIKFRHDMRKFASKTIILKNLRYVFPKRFSLKLFHPEIRGVPLSLIIAGNGQLEVSACCVKGSVYFFFYAQVDASMAHERDQLPT